MKQLSLSLVCLLLQQAYAAEPIRGFPEDEAKARQPFEERLRAMAESNKIRASMARLAREPHHAGSPASKSVAEYALAKFKEFGLEAHLESFDVMLPYPVQRTLEIVSPNHHGAKLREPVVKEDPDSGNANQIPTFNAYTANGDITAQVVYANYGLPEDYAFLKSKGVEVKGKIALVRYGRSFRGIKPKVAAENGAIGCLIYSDPKDDGYYQGDIYPKGPFRPPPGVQRGSVMDLPMYPGDPLTPGKPSIAGVPRIKMEDAKNIQKIPVLPISWEDAKPILEQIEGDIAPLEWRGAIPVTYHAGAGPVTVHMRVQVDNATRTIHDVIGHLKGSVYPDQYVIYGNHHDAWVNGAADPVSGAASLLESARILCKAAQQGWKPKRTIIFALWDAEEFGLIGSTEWAEKHRENLLKNAVSYFNSDSTLRGAMSVQATPSLEKFVEEWMRDYPDPATGKSLLESSNRKAYRAYALGSGSDYTAFVHHLGIASLNAGFEGNMSGVYHSIYDTVRWFQYFGDPDYVFTTAFAGFMATGLARMADAYVVPFDFGRVGRFIHEVVDELKKAPKAKGLGWDPLEREVDKIAFSSRAFGTAMRAIEAKFATLDRAKLKKLNEAVFQSERALTRPEGLPGREWYKYQLSAPGKYTGYGAKTLPGIREAIEAGKIEEAQTQMKAFTEALVLYNEKIRLATKLATEF
ncbi:M28 family peptidase [Bryobacter aggregatus]|uniref:M28 family peptidase n=1 Tax=Bryobacter aggregatus TaxID=360054 RepID=UPI00068F886E|nr:M28 family peptidase [Bryobacter aggregatus]